MSFLPLFIPQVQVLLSSGLLSDSFLSDFIFFSMYSDFYIATFNLALLAQASPECHAHPCNLVGPDGLISTSKLCPPPLLSPELVKDISIPLAGDRKKLRVPWNFPFSFTFSVQYVDRLNQLHFSTALESVHFSSSLFPSPSNLSSFHHVVN